MIFHSSTVHPIKINYLSVMTGSKFKLPKYEKDDSKHTIPDLIPWKALKLMEKCIYQKRISHFSQGNPPVFPCKMD